ncbi:hypothetical protein QQZ08_010875 [Neonectria magnoliae]|uniref:Dehydrin n=1 Tax=Neonectria magnoliae TaxID=2732573 RepID=A0ABR1HES9_9HYPO
MSSIVNKVKEALHSDKSTTEQPEGTHGTHNSRAANAADPRIDSDRDHRAAHNTTTGTSAHTGGLGNTHTTPGSTTHTTGTHVGAGNNYSSTGGTHTGTGAYSATDGPASKTDGPHNSNLLNKADPRVDSDRDHSRNLGANPHGTSGTGAYDVNQTTRTGEGFGSHTTHTGGLGNNGGLGNTHATHGNTTHTGGLGTSANTHSTAGHAGGIGSNTAGHSSGVPEGTAGHHNSRVANAADPRIDSDLDGSNRHQGTHTGGLGSSTGGVGHNTTTHATHGNTAHTGGLGSSTTAAGGAYGTGPAPHTAGPHKSDLLNKADPRVDSNLDGSKTYGGDKTFQQSNQSSAYTHKDPTDAAQVPPSVLQQHIGAPTVAHDKHEHDHARRHSVSHQEQHRGL